MKEYIIKPTQICLEAFIPNFLIKACKRLGSRDNIKTWPLLPK